MIATKEQERKTLEKIRKMVAELGENSYLASAFTGAFELAERNIEDDAAYTTQYYVEQTYKAAAVKTQLEENNKRMQADLEIAWSTLKNKDDKIEELQGRIKDLHEKCHKQAPEINALQEKLKVANLEIIALKARLYDYMVKEQAGA